MSAEPFAHKIQVAIVSAGLANVHLGAQSVSVYADGAYTGEISAGILREAGCRFCIVGHSERRTLFGEDDRQILGQLTRLLEADIQPILCVGETLEQREAGDTLKVVKAQLAFALGELSVTQLGSLLIAYEPVWAIGTGRTASPGQAQEVHAFIRATVAEVDAEVAQKIRLLYGGSMNPENAGELLEQADIDGGLIGGASLQSEAFGQIIAAASAS